MPSNHPSQFKKWLPAILFAVALHLLIAVIFINAQNQVDNAEPVISHQTTQVMTSSDDAKHKTSIPTATNEMSEQVKTLSAKDLKQHGTDPDKTNDDSNETAQKSLKSNATANTSSSLSNAKNQAQHTNTADDSHQNINNKKATKPDKPQLNADNEPLISTPVPNPNMPDNSSYNPQTASVPTDKVNNPNESLLLARDIPNAATEHSSTDANYDKAAKEVDELNDKISAGINEIKEQKMREIRAQQERRRAEYIKNNQPVANTFEPKQTQAVQTPLSSHSSDTAAPLNDDTIESPAISQSVPSAPELALTGD